jgi:ribonuclease P protein component
LRKISLPGLGSISLKNDRIEKGSLRIVIKKTFGSAVRRNRQRRIVKEAVRTWIGFLPDATIFVDTTAKNRTYALVQATLKRALNEFVKQG